VAAEFQLDAPDVRVRYNELNLVQVLTHLVMNAKEAMPRGGRLKVSTQVVTLTQADTLRVPPGPFLCITFQDSGKGIAPGDLPRIFDPYFSTKERGSQKGMGLGLALCEAILDSHGGFITALSEQGQGAVFRMHLPLT
jgi:signal transduction histidine kinase